jgi:NAD(P)-dependent dehydrogenase (short-subunit alcohol dehydrogenase family)
MTEEKILAGKVVIVTGAGRGIGREIACAVARAGAKVVVNDLGVTAAGQDPDSALANAVVKEIAAEGGDSIANGDSVADPQGAERIVRGAIEAFGRIDGVVNGAGILRDSFFHKMSFDDWKAVIDVHLHGTFNVSRSVAPHFKEQGSGSLVHLTSTSGLIGNRAQANYSAAKAGIAALSKSIALDMEKFHIRSNCISPFAWTRMTDTIPEITEADRLRVARLRSMTVSQITPLVIFLLSELSTAVTGQILAVRKNEIFLMSQSRPLRSIHRDPGWTARGIADQMLPAFTPSFYRLDCTADVFSWDPI